MHKKEKLVFPSNQIKRLSSHELKVNPNFALNKRSPNSPRSNYTNTSVMRS